MQGTPDYDLIVAGGGLAGLTAALFAARYGLSTLVLEAVAPGGHLVNVERIEDFPGFPDGVAGYELCPTLQLQAANQGADFRMAEFNALEPQGKSWRVVAGDESWSARTVIVATGSTMRELGVPGEARLRGRGVSTCATCDGPLFSGQAVGVVGGGDSALQEALTLADHASQVTILHRGAQFSAQHAFQGKVMEHPKIGVQHRVAVEEILGDEAVTGVCFREVGSGSGGLLEVSGVFVYVGLVPNTSALRGIVPVGPNGHVPTDSWMRTPLPGLFAAGDIREDSPAQAITSAGDGAAAAIAAHRYLQDGTWPVPS
ncbi:MAG: FAD-dependent oxidoreductase [Chloroflexi bacterium]|nr:FAD-dependent oxidoreductase [Chloroflexota bacterium]